MYGYVRPHRFALLAGGVLSLLTAATGLALPLVVRALIGDLGNHRAVAAVLLLMTVLVIANAALGAVGSYVLRRTAESVVLAARRRLVDRLLGLTIGGLDRAEPGDLMSRVTADTTLLRDVTTNSVVGVVTGSLTLVATLVLMGLMDLVLLGVTLGVFSVTAVVIGVVVPRIGRAARQAQNSVGVMGAALERMLGAFRTIKASGAEGREGERIHAAAREACGPTSGPPNGRRSPETLRACRCSARFWPSSPSAAPGSAPGQSAWAPWSRSCCTSST